MNGLGRGDNQENRDKNSVVTRETVGMTILLFSGLALLIAITRSLMFGDVGVAITAFLLGCFGYLTYPLLVMLVCISLQMVIGKEFLPRRLTVWLCVIVAVAFLIVHLATSGAYLSGTYGEYLASCFMAGEAGIATATAGGVLYGLAVYPIVSVLSVTGSYVVFAFAVAILIFFFVRNGKLGKLFRKKQTKKSAPQTAVQTPRDGVRAYPGTFDDLPSSRTSAPLWGAPQSAQGQGWNSDPRYATPSSGYQATGDQGWAQWGAQPQGYSQPQGYQPQGYPQPQGYQPQGYPQPQGYAQPQPQPQETAQPQTPRTFDPSDYHTSREILFSGSPASSYRENLIFDRDSQFNTQPRGSNMERVDPVQPSPYAGTSYQTGYTGATESGREPMPRKVVEELPSTATAPTPSSYTPREDVNYQQTPSYRAAQVPQDESPRDFYRNDVNPSVSDVEREEGLSSAPNVFDTPVAPSYRAPAERAEARPAPFTPAERAETRPAPEQTENQTAQTSREREASYRNLFSRPSASSRNIDFPPMDETFGRGATGRDDIFGSERFARTQPTPAPETQQSTPLRSDRFGGMQTEEPVSRVRDIPAVEDTPLRGDRFGGTPTEEPVSRVRDIPAVEDTPLRSDRFGGTPTEEPVSRVRDIPAVSENLSRSSASDLFDGDEGDYRTPDVPAVTPKPVTEQTVRVAEEKSTPVPEKPAPAPKKHVYKAYVRPSFTLLGDHNDVVSVSQEEIDRNSRIITDTLAGFRVEASVVRVTCGSAVTRYDIDIPPNVAASSVIKRSEEIAMRLHARDGVNMYTNREKGAISIEVPNDKRAVVGIKSVMASDDYMNAKPNALSFVLGKDVEGRPICGNIVKMKHLLVAGATGSGKSVCLNAMLISLISKYSPEDLRLILIDPKKVEFAIYDGLPHLMINEIISDAQKAVTALNWAIKEMERRFELFRQKTDNGQLVYNIDDYNGYLEEGEAKIPKIVIIIDELADLMSVAKKDIEERIQRLTQKARAAGIHLVIATQRPSVDVITGVIKGNLPTRIAFRVIQEVDSRTILDESGAEKLLGLGDMLYKSEGMFECVRVQGALVENKEVQAIVAAIKENNESYFDETVAEYINNVGSPSSDGGSDDSEGGAVDPQYIKALAIVVKLGQASISLIQRKCSVGYNHAGKIIEWMEAMGYISPFDGKAKARSVVLTKEQYESKYGSLD